MNIEKINEFIERKLNGRKRALASELVIEDESEMILLFGSALLSSDKQATYKVEVKEDRTFKCLNRVMTDFIIEIK